MKERKYRCDALEELTQNDVCQYIRQAFENSTCGCCQLEHCCQWQDDDCGCGCDYDCGCGCDCGCNCSCDCDCGCSCC